MKYICLYFQVHQPFRLRPFSFAEIGGGGSYFNEEMNDTILQQIAQQCYLPANKLLLDLIERYGGRFHVSFSISGTALDQFERYAPEVIDSFRKLADTGCVEFLGETYGHSLAALGSEIEFMAQIKAHADKIAQLFGQRPVTFRNTELIYTDAIGDMVHRMGFTTMLTEGAAHVLHWKSPNYIYRAASSPELKLLLKNYRLSDDIAFRFADRNWEHWPLAAGKFAGWLHAMPSQETIVNLFMDYETFGEHHTKETGIFQFLEAFPGEVFSKPGYRFVTPHEATTFLPPIAALSMPQPVSWADEARDLSAWLGNDLQQDAFSVLYSLEQKMQSCRNEQLRRSWLYLQTSDHFYYMCTKSLSDGAVHSYFSPYDTPFDAFMNYMNVLTDFSLQLDKYLVKKKKLMDEGYSSKTRLCF
ncbi:glycoside hydrolase family 57 protein [Chitinophaga sp. Ak27]|uniref:glycoside hydrolase family 57 protein n=1 Tax=Chitinophaga sp. Ak27 TaxID=2726116 RepID=UPI00145E173D|nr:glycoside hydrolase family 57 protein [Chitinophaga sp. Ak27]NLU91468.1 alpha-amylase [Chitinophaga sp. Ak27]